MSTIINGNAANVTAPLTIGGSSGTIVGAVAGSGITTCTTSVPHLYGNNDLVQIFGATGMTGLNAYWNVTVTGPTTFTVPSAISGTYGANSASALDWSLTPQFQWPSSGDTTDVQLSGLLSGATMLASYSQFLAGLLARTPAVWVTVNFGTTTYSGARCVVDWTNSSNLDSDASATGVWLGSWTWGSTSTVEALSGSTTTFATGSTLSVQGTFDVPAYNAITVSPAESRIIVQQLVPVQINSNCAMEVALGGAAYLQVPGNSTAGGYGNTLALTEVLDGTTIAVNALVVNFSSSGTHGTTAGVVYLVSIDASGNVTTLGQASLPNTGSGSGQVNLPDSGHGAVTISKAQYGYYLVIVGESSSSSATFQFFPPKITFSNITYVGQR